MRIAFMPFALRNLCLFLIALGLSLNLNSRGDIATESWMQAYNGKGDPFDIAVGIVSASNGNVFVSGYSWDGQDPTALGYVTIAYSNAGTPLWTNIYNALVATATAIDREGNILVTGYTFGEAYDFATIKYSSTGVPLWTNWYNGPANANDEANAIAVDSTGNVIVTGFDTQYGLGYAYATIEYSAQGVPLWTNRYDGPANTDAVAAAVAVDKDGNAYVTGNYGTFAYSSTGAGLWTNFAGVNASAIAVDEGGNIIIAGNSVDSQGKLDFSTIKYSNAGVPLWTNKYNGSGGGDDSINALALDRNGNVFVTGYSASSSDPFTPNYDFVTIGYLGTGVPLWTNVFNGSGNGNDTPTAIAVDSQQNVIVTGESSSDSGGFEYRTISYSGTGEFLWTQSFSAAVCHPSGITVDADDNVFVTGYFSNGTYDFATIKYSVLRPIPLSIQVVGGFPVLTWTNSTFYLQTATEVNGTFTNIPFATSPYTNTATGTQQFFRLSQ